MSLEFAAYFGTVLMNFPLGLAIVFLTVDLLGLQAFFGGLLAAALPPAVNYVLHTRVVFAASKAAPHA